MKEDDPFYFNDAEIHHPFLVESSLSITIAAHRLPYFTASLPGIESILEQKKIKLTHDRFTLTVSTTNNTRDPYILIKARDMLLLIARCVPYESAMKILEDCVYFDIIAVKPNENRMKRLEGPKEETLKALKLLTKTDVFVDRKCVCVIGRCCKMLRDVREIVECVFSKNVHPAFLLKRLMVKNEVMGDKDKSEMDWDNYLPPAKSKMKNSRGKKNKHKKEKENKNNDDKTNEEIDEE